MLSRLQLSRGATMQRTIRIVTLPSSSSQLHSPFTMRSLHSISGGLPLARTPATVALPLSRTALLRPASSAGAAAAARPWPATLSRNAATVVRRKSPEAPRPPLHMWSTQPHGGGHVISSSVKSGSSPVSNLPILIYSTQMTGMMRGLGYALLALMLPTAYYTWPVLWETMGPHSAGDAYDAVGASGLNAPALLTLNVATVGALAALAAFNRRVVHTIHLYPRTRTLAIRTLHTVGSKPRPLLVPLDAVQPPMVHHGLVHDVRLKLHIADAPRIDSVPAGPAAPANVWSASVNPEAHVALTASSSSSSSSSASSIRPAQSFYIFPFPNGATTAGREQPHTTATFARLLTTGMHSQSDLEQLAHEHDNYQ